MLFLWKLILSLDTSSKYFTLVQKTHSTSS